MRMRLVSLVLVLTAVAGCSRHSFERFFTSGERYLSAKQYAEAAIEFENAARANPGSVATQMNLGDAYAALGQDSNASAAYQRACALDPRSAKACVGSAAALLKIGDYTTAASTARVVLAADRFNLDAQLILASALTGVRRFADAEERLQAALAAAPDDPRVYKALSTVQLRRGNARAAEASLLQAIKLEPSAADARVSLGQLYLESGRAADGKQQLLAALDVAPDNLAANRTYASYLVTTEDCADAEKYWQMVAAKSPDDSGMLSLADYYVWSGRPDDALRVLAKVSSRDHSGAATVRTASILYDRGEQSTAARMVDALLAHDQASVNGLLLKARMSLDGGDAASARELVHRAAAVAPDAPAVREMLAQVNTQP